MRNKIALSLRGVVGLFMVCAFMVLGSNSASAAGAFCSPQTVGSQEYRALQYVDSNSDGIATIDEIKALGSAELNTQADQLAQQGYTGIQYKDCTAAEPTATSTDTNTDTTTSTDTGTATDTTTSTDTGTATDTTTSTDTGTATDTTTSTDTGTATDTTTSTDPGTGTDTSTGVDTLPNTGNGPSNGQSDTGIFLLLGAVGMIALGGSLALRQRRNS